MRVKRLLAALLGAAALLLGAGACTAPRYPQPTPMPNPGPNPEPMPPY